MLRKVRVFLRPTGRGRPPVIRDPMEVSSRFREAGYEPPSVRHLDRSNHQHFPKDPIHFDSPGRRQEKKNEILRQLDRLLRDLDYEEWGRVDGLGDEFRQLEKRIRAL